MMHFGDDNRNKRKLILGVVFGLLIGLGILGFFFVFPHALNKQWLINVQYLENGGNPRVITLYQEISSNDDGSFLKGYWLYIADPQTNKTLDKLFIKRTDKNNDIPTTPNMYCINNNEIWLVGDKGMYQGDVGYLAVIKANNDKLQIVPTDFMNDWTLSGSYNWYNTLTVVNKFNETGCLDMINHKVIVPICTYPDAVTARPKSCFFFLKNTATSTRSHLYFYKSSKELPEPGIFSGYTQEGEITPGWHLIDHVNMQRGFVMKPDMDAYKAQFDTSEKVNVVYEKDFLNNPNIIYSNDDLCILTASSDDGTGNYFYQFSSNGQLVWKVACPKMKSQTMAYGFNCNYYAAETIIGHTMNWVISINNSTGKINWQYPH